MAFTTRGSLLSAIRRGDEVSWDEFYRMYRPLILLRGGDLRLNQTEKEELVQLVMLSFFRTARTFHYDKSLGRFRDYLKRIIQNKACDLMRKRIATELNIELFDIYGLTEVYGPGIAMSCDYECGMHYWDDYLYFEIVDPKTGENVPDRARASGWKPYRIRSSCSPSCRARRRKAAAEPTTAATLSAAARRRGNSGKSATAPATALRHRSRGRNCAASGADI